MTVAEQKRAAQSIKDLQCGAKSFQRTVLPACHIPNASNIENFGKEVSDTVASWVKKGFAAGPFTSPPCKNFRVNRVLAIQQNEKVRPVLDLSEPKGASFNSNVCEEKLEKVVMSSSKKFGKALFEAGKHSTFSKFDYVDAYKNVPVQISDLRLQGFEWKNRYFVETRQVFGAKTAVQNFDILAHSILSVVNCETKIPKKYIHRTLDDIPVISPACENWTSNFDIEFTKTCSYINAKLVPDCPKQGKAFRSSKRGKVLGTIFDSETQMKKEKNI
jgi:hypothetical protein